MNTNPYRDFLSVGILLLVVLAVGIICRRQGVPESTEIIFEALAGIGILVNAWIAKCVK
jgi:hypothetical protein